MKEQKLSDIVKEYISKYPLMYKQSLAKLILKERPELITNSNYYKSLDNMRSYIRFQKGAKGKESRRKNDLFMDTYEPDYQYIIKPNHIIKSGKAFIISDLHGYNSQDAETLYSFFEYGKNEKCDTIILNGDVIDNEQLAKWAQLSKRQRIVEEYQWVQELLSDISDMFPGANLYYKFGNHEFWWQRAIWSNPNILEADNVQEALKLENILEIDKTRFNVIDYTQGMNLGKLTLFHGHEAKKSGKYVANALLMYYMQDVAFGHFHRIDKAQYKVFGKQPIRAYSLPCACNLQAVYMGNNSQWDCGFAICDFNEEDYELRTYIFNNNKIRII
jgi:predicted phosphodiesterase